MIYTITTIHLTRVKYILAILKIFVIFVNCQPTEFTIPTFQNCSGSSNRNSGPSSAEVLETLSRIEDKLGCGTRPTTFLCRNLDEMQDCEDVQNLGISKSGRYEVCFLGDKILIYCDFDTQDGPYMVFQRRMDGSTNFYRSFFSYVRGFGDVTKEFWLGLDKIYKYTTMRNYLLRVDLEDFDSNKRFAIYSKFFVNSSSTNYTLTISEYSGNAGDALNYHNGMPFSAYDRPNKRSLNCPKDYLGAWWYNECHHCNLNGMYLRGNNDQFAKGVVWFEWRRNTYSLKLSEMKMKKI